MLFPQTSHLYLSADWFEARVSNPETESDKNLGLGTRLGLGLEEYNSLRDGTSGHSCPDSFVFESSRVCHYHSWRLSWKDCTVLLLDG